MADASPPHSLPPDWMTATLEHVTDHLAVVGGDGVLHWVSPRLRGAAGQGPHHSPDLSQLAMRVADALRHDEEAGVVPHVSSPSPAGDWEFHLIRLGTDTPAAENRDQPVALAVLRPSDGHAEFEQEQAARRTRELTQANRELEALNEVALAVNQTLELSEVLGIALEKALDAAEIETGWVRLLAEDGSDELEMVAQRGLSAECAAAVKRVRLNDSFAGKVVLTGKPIVLYSLPQDSPACRHFAHYEGIRCLADIPLCARRRVIGVLGIGSRRILQITERLVHFLTAIGNQVGIAIENARLYEQVQRRAWLDSLTQLYNRQRFHELLEVAMRERGAAPPVLLLDVDRFKELNDTLGHVHGDRALRRVAEHLRQQVSPNDIVGRFGGDEFVVALLDRRYQVDPSAIARLIAAIQTPVEAPHPEHPITLTLSIGMASAGSSVEDLLHRADQAMYAEKRHRRK